MIKVEILLGHPVKYLYEAKIQKDFIIQINKIHWCIHKLKGINLLCTQTITEQLNFLYGRFVKRSQ